MDLRFLLARVVDTGVPGAIGLAAQDDAVRVDAAGLADVTGGIPLTPDHRFRVGSITKTFLSTVVLQLFAEGRVRLDDSVAQHVPGVIRDGADVTLRALLNHTSGIPDYFFAAASGDLHRTWTPRELVELSSHAAPGERGRFAYSNTNYLVLGLAVEAVTGATVEQQLEHRIIRPLGLSSTGTDAIAVPIARGYLAPSNPIVPSTGSQLVDVSELGSTWAWPALVSSARDIARFLQRLLGGELLPAELLDQMLAGVESDWVESDRYGLGIEEVSSLMGVSHSPLGSFWGHAGLGLGHTVVALASRDGRQRTVVMVNQGMIDDEMWQAIGDVAWPALA